MSYDENLIGNPLRELRGHLTEMNGRIARAESELNEIKAVRNRIAAAVRALDPPPKPTPKKKNGAPVSVSEESLRQMTEWLRERGPDLNLDGFWVTGLDADPDFTIYQSDAGIRSAVKVLHERGVIALDRVAQGGRRVYKVVTE